MKKKKPETDGTSMEDGWLQRSCNDRMMRVLFSDVIGFKGCYFLYLSQPAL